MNKIFLLLGFFFFVSCGKDRSKSGEDFSAPSAPEKTTTIAKEYDPNRGEGKFTKIELGLTLNKTMVAEGLKVAEVKCISCHKTTDEKLVGPGWKGVTKRKKPEWIMNFITNPEAMIDKDPELQAQLELCLIRMPNQGLTDNDARHVLEYMRQIDGVK